jgi:hypothetical protein
LFGRCLAGIRGKNFSDVAIELGSANKEAQGMIKLELSAKMLRFVIEAVEERIAGYSHALEDATLSENELADIGNDWMVLRSAVDYLKQVEQAGRERP